MQAANRIEKNYLTKNMIIRAFVFFRHIVKLSQVYLEI